MKSSFPSTDGASQVMCSEGAADQSSVVPFTRVDPGAPSELGCMVLPIPGAPLRYTPGFHAARVPRLRAISLLI